MEISFVFFVIAILLLDLAIVGVITWQAQKRFGKKGLFSAISIFAALILFGFTWNCCTSWNSEAFLSENLATGAKRTIGKNCLFWLKLVTPAQKPSNPEQ